MREARMNDIKSSGEEGRGCREKGRSALFKRSLPPSPANRPAPASSFFRGMRLAVPVLLGYLPVGFTFGILAVQAGMNPLTVGLTSWFVYAGSAQLIAAGMLGAGAGPAAIIVTTFVVNLRHLLMSAALAPYLRPWSRPLQAWFSFEMTDETFALNLSRFSSAGVDRAEALGVNCLSHLAWTTGGVAGALFDKAIGDIRPFGLDFALTGMFIALILPHVRVPRRLLALCSGAALSLIFALLGMDQWNVMLATACAATIAAFAPLPDGRGAGGRGAEGRAGDTGAKAVNATCPRPAADAADGSLGAHAGSPRGRNA